MKIIARTIKIVVSAKNDLKTLNNRIIFWSKKKIESYFDLLNFTLNTSSFFLQIIKHIINNFFTIKLKYDVHHTTSYNSLKGSKKPKASYFFT